MPTSIRPLKTTARNKAIAGREGEGRGGVLREKTPTGPRFLDSVSA